jgi:hypothetical protein
MPAGVGLHDATRVEDVIGRMGGAGFLLTDAAVPRRPAGNRGFPGSLDRNSHHVDVWVGHQLLVV